MSSFFSNIFKKNSPPSSESIYKAAKNGNATELRVFHKSLTSNHIILG